MLDTAHSRLLFVLEWLRGNTEAGADPDEKAAVERLLLAEIGERDFSPPDVAPLFWPESAPWTTTAPRG